MAYNSSRFSNANGVTFGTQTGLSGNVVTASVAAVGGAQTGISGLSAGTTQLTSGTAVFSNSNGVSFGVNGNTVTASFSQSTQSSNFYGTGNTTYSSSGSLNGSSFILRGDGLVSVGISNDSVIISSPASTLFQYTSNTSNITSNALNSTSPRINVSAGTTSNNMSAITFSNLNGVSFGLNGSVVTASYNSTQFQSTGNYLTTAAQSNQVVNSLNGSTGQISLNVGSSLSASSNGSSITFGLASNITTALQSTGAYLTTAMASNRGSDFMGTNTALTANGVSMTANSSGLSLNFPAFLTTARASNDAVGLNTAKTNVTWTVNSSGISFDASGYVGTASAFSGTNVSATMTHNSAGFSLQLSAPNAGAGGGIVLANSQTTYTSGTVNIVEGGGAITVASTTGQSYKISVPATSSIVGVGQITISTNGSTISISGATVGNPIFSAGTTSNNLGSIVFSNSNGVSFGLNGSTITASAAGAGGAAIKGSGTYTQNTGTVEFANSNGITFGLSNNGTMTASHNGLTTARASNDAVGLNTAQTNVTWTVNSSGISINASGYAGTGVTTASTAGSDFAITNTTNGLSMGVPKFLTTAMQSNAATISNINVSGGTTSSNMSAINFVNSNGVSWSLDTASKVYATVKTDYLTTAMASNRGSDFVQATAAFNGTNASGTIASGAISVSVAAQSVQTQNRFNLTLSGNSTSGGAGYIQVSSGTLTLAGGNNITLSQDGNAVTISGPNVGGAQTGISGVVVSNTTYTSGTVTFQNANGISFGSSGANGISASYTVPSTAGLLSAINVSAGTTSSNQSSIGFSNANSVSFGFSGASITASIPAFLTTARASTDAVGLNTALTAGPLAWTVNSSGISLNASSAAGTTSGFGGNLISGSMTHNTAGLNLSLNHPAWLTTAMQSNAATISNINISAGTTSTNASAFTFNNANGITFGLGTGASAGSITASHNGLTTARASTDAIGLNTAQSNVTWTVNSSGLSLDARGYAGTATTFNGTNVSGSMTLNSNGLRLDLSAPTPGGGAAINVSAGTTSGNLQTIVFSNSNGVSFGLNGSTVTASAAAGAGGGVAIAASNTTFTSGTVVMSASGGAITINSGAQSVGFSVPATSSFSATGKVSLSTNGSTISIGVPNPITLSGYSPYADLQFLTLGTSQGTLSIEPQVFPNFQFDRIVFPINNTNSSNSSGSHSLSFRIGIYSKNASSLSLVFSTSSSTAITHSGTAGSYSLFSGMRLFTIPATTTFTEGRYWIAFNSNSTSGGANGSYSLFGLSQQASNFLGMFGQSHNTTAQFTLGQGIYTVSTTGIPGSIAFSQIRGSDSAGFRSPIIGFASSTI